MNAKMRRKAYVFGVDECRNNNPLKNQHIARAINKVALELGDKKTPAVSTVSKWYRQYVQERAIRTIVCSGDHSCN